MNRRTLKAISKEQEKVKKSKEASDDEEGS